MSSEKLVSIGMPVYNGEEVVSRAIDSLLGERYKNFELVISDDASGDRTPEICEKYAKRDNRISFFRQKENLGFARNFNFVLKKTRGEYFMWAAQDDWWEKSFIEKMVQALDRNPRHVVAMSHFKVRYPGSDQLFETPLGRHNFTSLSNHKLYQLMLDAKDNPIFEYGLWRREFLKRLFSRLKPKCIEDTIILISEAALAGRFYSVLQMLHLKERDPRPLKERHYLGQYYRERFPYAKFVWTGFFWHLTSPVIPFYRKFLIFWPWLSIAWRFKGKILRELFYGKNN